MYINARWMLAAAAVLCLLLLAALWVMYQYPFEPYKPADTQEHPRMSAVSPADEPGDSPAAGGQAGPLPPLKRPRLLIRKSAQRLTVYDGDRAVKSYPAATGAGRGDKLREGDRCTPHGQFIICLKNPNSRFSRALGLSYPNIEDARRGLADGLISQDQHDDIVAAIRQGRTPPWDTPLGGEIMIHGGGAGRDWTDGCIALDDADILELYRALPVGTPVTILP